MSLDRIFVGNTTHYTTPCFLGAGRLHRIFIRSKINLRDPMQEMFVDTSYFENILGKENLRTFKRVLSVYEFSVCTLTFLLQYQKFLYLCKVLFYKLRVLHVYFIVLDKLLILITEPRKPGKVISSLSNFSADGVHLVWEKSDAFVNRYRVEIDGHNQQTLDSKPEIHWNRLLLPVTQYNVTITAISYGFVSNYASYGRKESQPAANWIMTTECKPKKHVWVKTLLLLQIGNRTRI